MEMRSRPERGCTRPERGCAGETLKAPVPLKKESQRNDTPTLHRKFCVQGMGARKSDAITTPLGKPYVWQAYQWLS
ncbi:hypothetical protein BaRGS_00029784 [Batillaria attramentaria]|uniref:Uncharacterized protein n=1 Tax=Batillaria attramentaria TaxID=370345 RepID=A0ABD0JWZ4_9CAEN